MEKSYEEIINDLEKVESKLDLFLEKEDFENFNVMIEYRMKIFKKLEKYSDEPVLKEKLSSVFLKDKTREEKVKKIMENTRKSIKDLNKGKTAFKNGYYNVQNELIKKKIDKSG